VYKILKISDSILQQCLTMELVSAVWCKERDVIEVLFDKKESMRSIHKCLCRVYGTHNVDKHCWSLGENSDGF